MLHVTSGSALQIRELNTRLRQMAEDKRSIQKDRDRLERIVKSNAAPQSSQVCITRSLEEICMLWLSQGF